MLHRSIPRVALALLGASMLAAPAAANPLVALDQTLATYNVFTFGDFGSATNPYSADSQGSMAVGGNAYFQDFNVAANTNHGVNALTVGGDLTETRVANHGNVFVGGNANFPVVDYAGSTVYGTLTVNGTVASAPTQYNNGNNGPIGMGVNPVNFG